MSRKIITTGDGSKSIFIEEWNEHYHSIHGAIQEANHVFIKHGLLFYIERNPKNTPIQILEIGFGTGLNTYVTLLEAQKRNLNVEYVGVEGFPISNEEILALNFPEQLNQESGSLFEKIHVVSWEEIRPITSFFTLKKQHKLFENIKDLNCYDLIYFDAFGARVQPELWTETIFKSMFDALNPGGVLVTYSAKGSVRRAMLAVGFKVEKLQGPPGKREMLRAIKISNSI